jgi:hypothetical protein
MRHAGGLTALLSALVLAVAMSGPTRAADLETKQVLKPLREAWRDHSPCWSVSVCDSYFDSFGVALLFADGTTAPFQHVQRLTISAHDCLENAKDYLARGERGLAVQWAMASQRSASVRDWMREHPDDVIELLRNCC